MGVSRVPGLRRGDVPIILLGDPTDGTFPDMRRLLMQLGGLAVALTTSLPLAAQPDAWCDQPARAGYESLERVRVRDPWFHVYRLDDGTFALYEPDNFQEVISWLIVGRSRALLFDTGMGMGRIAAVVGELTRLPVTVVNSHSHYDHIGGNAEFPDVRAMETAFTRRNAAGIPHAQVAQEVRPDALCRTRLTARFDTAIYAIRPFRAAGALRDGTTFDLGGRTVEVLAVPGHTPDAIALLDRARGHLWTGDTFYPGPVWLYFPGTDLDAYEASLVRLAALAPTLTRVFTGHNLPSAEPAALPKLLARFREVRTGRVPGTARGEGLVEYPGDGFSFLMRAPSAPLRILFIGNSYTYYNDLPHLVADFARTARYERPVQVEMVTRPGVTLRDHWNAGDALAAIRRGPWDFVVLQEQSMLGVLLVEGAPAVNDPELFQTYARRFIREIDAVGATPVLYLTWARKATPTMQARLTSAYAALARETRARLAPVGVAWERTRTAQPALELFDPDGSHPSPTGSYLAAATIWATIDGTPALGLPPIASSRPLLDSLRLHWSDSIRPVVTLTESDAAALQGQADAAIAEVPSLPTDVPPAERLAPLPVDARTAWSTLAGRWRGTMRLYDAPVAVELTVTEATRRLDWRVVGDGWSTARTITDARVDSSGLVFTIADPRFLAPDERHRAVLTGDSLIGHAEVGGAMQVPRLIGTWRLIRTASPDSTAAARRLAQLVAQQERWMTEANANLLGGGEAKLPDLSTAAVRRAAERAQGVVAALDSLRRDELTLDEWTTTRLLRFEQEAAIDEARYHGISFAFITPYQSPLSSIPSLFGRVPLGTAAEAARYLRLLDSIPMVIDTIIGKLEDRRARHVLLPREEIRLVAPFVRSFAAAAERSPFRPAAARLARLPEAERRRVVAAIDTRITRTVTPAFERLAAYLEGPYRSEAPADVGLSRYPEGEAYYRALVRRSTTMDVTPEQVHAIGLAEVARLDSLMATVRARLGFTGTKAEFHAQLATDPRFFATTPEEFGARLMLHDARIRPRVGEWFAREPRARGDVRRLDPFLEASMTFGFYQVPTPQDSMGHYFYNGSNLPDRSMLGAAALVFHELIPGHHFQLAFQREATDLSTFRRMTTHTAFVEGWGEYAATLAGELGMYEDPYDLYGRLTMDMFLACRLVVDTGMNLLGWSRERAMAFLREYTLQSNRQIDTETLRYAVDLPGQALAYKMGSRELMVLREEARTRLGARFDIRRWHAFVLEGGSLPLDVLRERQEVWIAGGGR